MQCELCGGLVTWRGPLGALTHTECKNCGGQNCQVAEPVGDDTDEPQPETFVGHSVMRGGWCVYAQVGAGEYEVLRCPFGSQGDADASLERLVERSKTPNAKVSGS
jgi:hypothetical protein